MGERRKEIGVGMCKRYQFWAGALDPLPRFPRFHSGSHRRFRHSFHVVICQRSFVAHLVFSFLVVVHVILQAVVAIEASSDKRVIKESE